MAKFSKSGAGNPGRPPDLFRGLQIQTVLTTVATLVLVSRAQRGVSEVAGRGDAAVLY
jgi:hypothetical protein